MLNLLDNAYIWARAKLCRAKDRVEEFLSSQDGISNVVATIIVLLITVLLIAAFWDQLQTWIQGIMDQIFGTGFDDGGLG